MLSDFNHFRLEEIPPRLEAKQKLLKLFEEIQVISVFILFSWKVKEYRQ